MLLKLVFLCVLVEVIMTVAIFAIDIIARNVYKIKGEESPMM
jgi:hypothetical protein